MLAAFVRSGRFFYVKHRYGHTVSLLSLNSTLFRRQLADRVPVAVADEQAPPTGEESVQHVFRAFVLCQYGVSMENGERRMENSKTVEGRKWKWQKRETKGKGKIGSGNGRCRKHREKGEGNVNGEERQRTTHLRHGEERQYEVENPCERREEPVKVRRGAQRAATRFKHERQKTKDQRHTASIASVYPELLIMLLIATPKRPSRGRGSARRRAPTSLLCPAARIMREVEEKDEADTMHRIARRRCSPSLVNARFTIKLYPAVKTRKFTRALSADLCTFSADVRHQAHVVGHELVFQPFCSVFRENPYHFNAKPCSRQIWSESVWRVLCSRPFSFPNRYMRAAFNC
ncbi:hypothetical protein K438DRAFT_1758148 [Mycena galopus ATCC 62051]|nr:hypothetical protein K438DRAFT_1758148 [Mycena galopus ATCC 62051]